MGEYDHCNYKLIVHYSKNMYECELCYYYKRINRDSVSGESVCLRGESMCLHGESLCLH